MKIRDVQEALNEINREKGWAYILGGEVIKIATDSTSLDDYAIADENKLKSIWIDNSGFLAEYYIKGLSNSARSKVETIGRQSDFKQNLKNVLEVFSEISEDY